MNSTSTRRDLKSLAASIASLPRDQIRALIEELSPNAQAALPYLFEVWGLGGHQLPPKGTWTTWLILGGRGAGKTRAGAEWIRSQVEGATPLNRGRREKVCLIAETIDQAVEVMIRGDSGLLACSPKDRRPEYNASRKILIWPNGAQAQVFSASNPESLRGPQFDCAWADELGCPAVDLGANQPNVFVDPKSSESFLPYYSVGARDDYMQQRYIQAVVQHWDEDANNPTSSEYDGRMLDVSNVYLWTWDARPWPDFPLRSATWSDGGNHRLGHWLTGRLGAAPLQDVVADICNAAGLSAFDVSALYGVVTGVNFSSGETGREKLQSLMLTHGFDAVESGGVLTFRHRGEGSVGDFATTDALLTDTGGRAVEFTRQAEGELPRALRLSYVAADDNYETAAIEAQTAFAASPRVEGASAPVALDASRAQHICDRWLSEAHISRDGAQISAGRSTLAFETGDVISLDDACTYRIDRIEELGAREMTLTRVEPLTHAITETPTRTVEPKAVTPAAPVAFHLMDLPIIGGGGESDAVKFAAFANPWTSAANLFLSLSEEDYQRQAIAPSPAIMGRLSTTLAAGAPDRLMRGDCCDVTLFSGGLSARPIGSVLNGANRAAIQRSDGEWEIVQFLSAVLLPNGDWRLSELIRGQAGTDPLAEVEAPVGSPFVFLNSNIVNANFDPGLRGVDLTYLIGPSHKPYTHFSYQVAQQTITGAALRPYRPAHMQTRFEGGDLIIDWVRRSRRDGDSWDGLDIPIGEDREAYLLRIVSNGVVLREATTSQQGYVYSEIEQIADGATGAIEILVAQISDQYGPGPASTVTVNV